MLSQTYTILEQWLFSTQCLLCQNKMLLGKNLCSLCVDELPWNYQACLKCAIPMEISDSDHLICGKCLHRPRLFADRAYAALVYQTPITQMVGQLKFNQNLIFGSVLSQLLLTFLERKYQSQVLPQAIIPVPLHSKRLSERGYNQALELAKPVGRAFKIPVYFDVCQRVKETLPQSSATAKERRINLRNAFEVKSSRTLKHVAIIDDVLTTGSTIMTLSKALKKKRCG